MTYTPRKKDPMPSSRPAAAPTTRRSSFAAAMRQARTHMHTPARIWSMAIHWRPVELLGDAIGGTLARPIALLTGSLFSLIATLGIYIVAKHYGYPLTGSEPFAAFALGWAVGTVIDYTRLLITGGKR